MNYKKGSRNGDYFARGAQESQAWAAEHITGGGDASSPRMHEEGKQQREKTQHLNHGTMLAWNQKCVKHPGIQQDWKLETLFITQPVELEIGLCSLVFLSQSKSKGWV